MGFYQRQAAKMQMQATKLQWDRSIDHIYLEVDKAYMQTAIGTQSCRSNAASSSYSRSQ